MILAVPEATPVTIPVLPTVAVNGSALVHVPAAGAPVSAAVPLTHIEGAPVIVGRAFTVTTAVRKQPAPREYEMVVVPWLTPVTTPVDALTEATPVLVLLHVPPVTEPERLVVPAIHAANVPVMVGRALTVITAPLVQPAADTTEITVTPAETPVKRPLPEIVAADGLELVHDVVAGALVRFAAPPIHTDEAPPTTGVALMVTTFVLAQPEDKE